MRRIVITGGPGAGKTTLLHELSSRGYATVEESARSIIAERLAHGLTSRPEPLAFAGEIFERDRVKYENPPQGVGLVFYDRRAVKALAMLHEVSPITDEYITAKLVQYAFYCTVFIWPPWQVICVNDAERDHSFSHAVAVHGQLVHWVARVPDLDDALVPLAAAGLHPGQPTAASRQTAQSLLTWHISNPARQRHARCPRRCRWHHL